MRDTVLGKPVSRTFHINPYSGAPHKENNMIIFTSFTSAVRFMFTLVVWAAALAATVTLSNAQSGRVPVPMRQASAPYSYPAPKAPRMKIAAFVSAADNVDPPSEDFKKVPRGTVALLLANVKVSANNPIMGFSFVDDNGNDLSSVFRAEKHVDANKAGDPCGNNNQVAAGTCGVLIGFSPADDHSAVSATVTIQFLTAPDTPVTITLKATGDKAPSCQQPARHSFPLWQSSTQRGFYPLLPSNIPVPLANKVYGDLGDPIRKAMINCFYNTDTPFTAFNQYKSIYNAASGSTTVKLQLGSMNFGNGMQLTLATNPQISTTGTTTATASTGTLTNGVPTLSSTSSAQAAQNILNGGTFYGEDLYPLFSTQGNWMLSLYGAVREGIDIQKFNNTSITLTNPASHTFVGFDGYFQYNSVNNAANSTNPAGSIFLGAMYGYNLMNHTYSLQNGFAGKINTQLAQVTAGVLLNGTVNIAASYGFGPSQRYVDSTSMATTTINNFNKWSFAIAYQTSSKSK